MNLIYNLKVVPSEAVIHILNYQLMYGSGSVMKRVCTQVCSRLISDNTNVGDH